MKLVTDRTYEDVLSGNEKGIYAYEDLNRVEQAVAELCDLMQHLDIRLQLVTKTDWDLPGLFSSDAWPVESQMERYLGNVFQVLERLDLTAPLPASMEHLDYRGANQIEQALVKARERIEGVTDTFRFSGELFAGEEIV